MDKLNEWLQKHDARKYWSQPVKNLGELTCYGLGNSVCIILAYKDHNGWELFVPSSPNHTDIATTLEQAEKVLEL